MLLNMAGLYIHIPICRRKCLYCDFFSCGESVVDKAALLKALMAEMRARRDELSGKIDTLYIGGGTPSLLPATMIAELISEADSVWGLKSDAEITVEVNPDDVDDMLCRGLLSAGVNRLSAGIQSLVDEELKAVGRRHDSRTAVKAMQLISEAFDNCSFDLIFGLPGQTFDTWHYSLEGVLKFEPKHLSAYSLMYESGTPLTVLRDKGMITESDDEEVSHMFELLMDHAALSGYSQYEISNFARPGYESRHNSSYWSGTPYLGIGPSAHSYDGRYTRRFNPADTRKYIDAFSDECRLAKPYYIEESLSDDELHEEYILTRLRTRAGISLSDHINRFGTDLTESLLKKAAPHIANGNLRNDNVSLMLTKRSILISDTVIVDLL